MGQPEPTRNLIDTNPFLTHLKWPSLTRNPIDPTQPDRFAMSRSKPALGVVDFEVFSIQSDFLITFSY